jgi:hypothetical protein
MWPYWLLFMIVAINALSFPKIVSQYQPIGILPSMWSIMSIVLVMMIGLRHEVGGDWYPYVAHLEAATSAPLQESFGHGDPAYSLANWIAAHSGFGIYLVNSFFALLFTWGLMAFCRKQPRPWLALVVSVPYLITVVVMGYSRQGVAIGLVMLGLVSLQNKNVIKFLAWLALAATFHKSAIILIPLAAITGSKRPFLTILLVAATSVLLFSLLLQEYIDGLRAGYLNANYESTGAAIRVAMNALPACVFLILRKRFALPLEQEKFWTWMALFALAFIMFLYISPSSTAVDRVALYLIPLQLFVWSRVPDAIGRTGGINVFWVSLIIAYSAAVQFVWLFFATHSYLWIPYQFYPWVWLWQ